MADHEEDASSQSIRRSSRTIRRPPRFTEEDEDSGVDGATLETAIDGETVENQERIVEIQDEVADQVIDANQEGAAQHLSQPVDNVLPGGVVRTTQDPLSENDKILNARWGSLNGVEIRESVNKAYQTVTRWKRNLFYLPTGKAGESFIEELTKVINYFNIGGVFRSYFPNAGDSYVPSAETGTKFQVGRPRVILEEEVGHDGRVVI